MSNTAFAVIESAGKQHTVKTGSRLSVDRLNAEVGATITLDNVLVAGNQDGTGIKVGAPKVAGASVKAKVLAHDRGTKVIIYKKIRRTGYMKRQGHRQEVTHLLVESVSC
jgi:large subunit ribosomal protein L21